MYSAPVTVPLSSYFKLNIQTIEGASSAGKKKKNKTEILQNKRSRHRFQFDCSHLRRESAHGRVHANGAEEPEETLHSASASSPLPLPARLGRGTKRHSHAHRHPHLLCQLVKSRKIELLFRDSLFLFKADVITQPSFEMDASAEGHPATPSPVFCRRRS